MQRLAFDSGVKAFQLGDAGVLRFNPSDPNVYARFVAATEKILSVEDELVEKAKRLELADDNTTNGVEVLKLLEEADVKVKQLLNDVFGGGNDFNKILGGVNLMAVAGNGERVITNLIAALEPVMVEGAESMTKQKVDAAVAKANQNRAQRRAANKKKRRKKR